MRQRETAREGGTRGGLRHKSPLRSQTPVGGDGWGGDLKGYSVSPCVDGEGWGAGASICRGQQSCWSAQGAPRYPVIHDNQRDREREGE